MHLWQKFLNTIHLRRFVVLLIIIAVLFSFRKMMSLFLLTFIFAFLVIHVSNFLKDRLKIPYKVSVVSLYTLIIGGLYLAATIYIPKLINQIQSLVNFVINFYNHPPKGADDVWVWISKFINQSELNKQLKGGVSIIFEYATSIGHMGFIFVMALLFSFFYTIEKDSMYKFSKHFLTGPFSWFFKDIYYFAKTFTNSFGVVLETQFIIAIVNTILTTICLSFMHMPQILSLGLLIFLMSLIPVAGVIISAIPMCIIGYSIGGLRYIIYIVIMLCVIHAIEAYVLNPKLMSSRTELPIFYTFAVLFVSEEIFGVWGLIVGIPIFTFILEIMHVKGDDGLSIEEGENENE